DRVRRGAREAEGSREARPVDRQGRAGEGGGAERALVAAGAGGREAVGVPEEHLDVGEAPVAEGDGLRLLEVRVAGHRSRRLLEGAPRERGGEIEDGGARGVEGPQQVQAEIGRDLIVARAAGVELAGEGADLPGERRLDERVDVL